MALWPERNLGLFLSLNSQAGGGAYSDILEAFCDHYFPEKVSELEPQTADFLKRFTGTYEVNRYPHNDIFKISKLMSVAKFTATDDGRLKMEMGENVDYFSHKEGLTFRKERSSEVIVFKEGKNDIIEHMYVGGLPIIAFDRIVGIDTPDIQITILTVTMAVILLTFIYWTLIFFIKRRLNIDSVPINTIPGVAKTSAWFIMLLILIFYIGLAVTFSNPFEIVYGIPAGLKVLLFIPFLVIILALVMTVQAWNIWKDREVGLFGKIWYTLIWACILTTIWQWNYWNFLGWNY